MSTVNRMETEGKQFLIITNINGIEVYMNLMHFEKLKKENKALQGHILQPGKTLECLDKQSGWGNNTTKLNHSQVESQL